MVPDRLRSGPAGDLVPVEAMMWWQGWQSPKQIRERVRSLSWDQLREQRARVTCPCCRGKKRINVVRHVDGRTVLELALCLQCEGTGELDDISGG